MKNIDNDFQEKKSNFMCRFQDRKKKLFEKLNGKQKKIQRQ